MGTVVRSLVVDSLFMNELKRIRFVLLGGLYNLKNVTFANEKPFVLQPEDPHG